MREPYPEAPFLWSEQMSQVDAGAPSHVGAAHRDDGAWLSCAIEQEGGTLLPFTSPHQRLGKSVLLPVLTKE